MLRPGLAGVTVANGVRTMWPAPAGNAAGNNLPPITGAPDRPFQPGPTGRGQSIQGGQLGGTGDGMIGADPRAPKIQPWPRQIFESVWNASVLHPSYGFNGFNDKLTVKDRHAYWDTGNQKTGTDPAGSGGTPQTYNDPKHQPPRPDLRTVNRTVSYQIGTDTTRNQDDLTRPYTWLGEQGSGWSPVYGGTPGLYSVYGSRGGIPYPIVSPVPDGAPGDGRHLVFAGPPHGLHTQTPWKGGAQIISRFSSIPQTRPVRQDRPSNSPQAGQSYSQTVRPQGASPVRPGGAPSAPPPGGLVYGGGRGWAGQVKTAPTRANWLFGRSQNQ